MSFGGGSAARMELITVGRATPIDSGRDQEIGANTGEAGKM